MSRKKITRIHLKRSIRIFCDQLGMQIAQVDSRVKTIRANRMQAWGDFIVSNYVSHLWVKAKISRKSVGTF